MKYNLKEINRLPLAFKYLDIYKSKNIKIDSSAVYYLQCEKYQTHFHVREKPLKYLTRLL